MRYMALWAAPRRPASLPSEATVMGVSAQQDSVNFLKLSVTFSRYTSAEAETPPPMTTASGSTVSTVLEIARPR